MTIRRTIGYRWPYSKLSKQSLGFRLPIESLSIPSDQIIIPANGTYSQSSVYTSNQAADAASMTDGSIANTTKTATNGGGTQWIKIDYGSIKFIRTITIGDYTSSLAGGWGTDGQYLSGCYVQYSNDDSSWTSLFNLKNSNSIVVSFPAYCFAPNTAPATYVLAEPVYARYVRLLNASTSGGYIACTEFYASST